MPVGAFGPPDERVLGEIAHEMGNHFHKLYYWTDYLREQMNGHGEPESGAVDMLSGAVERLETFMRMILEYLAPAKLCFSKVRVGELVGGLASRLAGRRLRFEGLEENGDTLIFADPGLVGHAIRTVFERSAATLVAEDEMVIRVSAADRRGYRGVEIEFRAGASPSIPSLSTGIEMAVAEKFLTMHGAEVFERDGAPRALVIFLPLYA